MVKKSEVSSFALLFASVKPMLTPPLVHSHGGFAVFATTGGDGRHNGCPVLELNPCILNEFSGQFGTHPPGMPTAVKVNVPGVDVSTGSPNFTTGAVSTGEVKKPTAANHPSMATATATATKAINQIADLRAAGGAPGHGGGCGVST